MKNTNLISRLNTDGFLWAVYILATAAVSLQRLAIPLNREGYTSYENYRIFRNSFTHLMAGLNPYAAYPAEQWDLYKYSPAFAIWMAPWSVLPDGVGIMLWNFLNSLSLLYAILKLPVLPINARRFMAWLVLLELITSLQNCQSNGLIAALILLAFSDCENNRLKRAGFWISTSVFVKIFGIFAAVPALLYSPQRRFILAGVGWGLFFAVLPVAFLGFNHTVQVYQWWWQLLAADHSASTGLSVLGWFETWLGINPPKSWITFGGIAVLVWSGLSAWRSESLKSRIWLWASVLIWVVIFNHKAESPTFIIAMCGIALWYLVGNKGIKEKVILAIAFLLTSLTTTDIFPAYLRDAFVKPYVLKALPSIIIWIWLSVQLIAAPGNPKTRSENLQKPPV